MQSYWGGIPSSYTMSMSPCSKSGFGIPNIARECSNYRERCWFICRMYMGGLPKNIKKQNVQYRFLSTLYLWCSFCWLTGANFGASYTPLFQIWWWDPCWLVDFSASAACIEHPQSLDCTKMPYPSDATTLFTTVLWWDLMMDLKKQQGDVANIMVHWKILFATIYCDEILRWIKK